MQGSKVGLLHSFGLAQLMMHRCSFVASNCFAAELYRRQFNHYKRQQNKVKKNGGNYSKSGDWQPYVVTDGLLITGQNPASSEPAAQALLKLLG